MVLRGLTMHETAVYRIRFQGAVDDSWKQHLDAGWTIQYANSIPETMTITGIMRDQAALIGLSEQLYESPPCWKSITSVQQSPDSKVGLNTTTTSTVRWDICQKKRATVLPPPLPKPDLRLNASGKIRASGRGFKCSISLRSSRSKPVWDLNAFQFLEDESAPPSVNPSLWRQSRLNANYHGLFKIVDGVYQIGLILSLRPANGRSFP